MKKIMIKNWELLLQSDPNFKNKPIEMNVPDDTKPVEYDDIARELLSEWLQFDVEEVE